MSIGTYEAGNLAEALCVLTPFLCIATYVLYLILITRTKKTGKHRADEW